MNKIYLVIMGSLFAANVSATVLDFSAYDFSNNWDVVANDSFITSGVVFDTDVTVLNSLRNVSDSGGAGISTLNPIGGSLSGFFTGIVSSVDFISVWVGDEGRPGTDIDTVLFEGFNINGDLVASDTYTSLGPRQMSITGSGITNFRFTGFDTITPGLSVAFDDFTFNPEPASVPEASSIYLLAFGWLGLFGAARRKV